MNEGGYWLYHARKIHEVAIMLVLKGWQIIVHLSRVPPKACCESSTISVLSVQSWILIHESRRITWHPQHVHVYEVQITLQRYIIYDFSRYLMR